MFAPVLLTLVLASANADDRPDAATLIGRLGAEAFDDRVAAYKALESLGGEALPSLRAAADAGDARVRVRALIDSLSRQVERDRFARVTPVRLDFRDRPLGEVIDALNDRHDLGLSLRLGPDPGRGMVVFNRGQPDGLKALRDRPITLEAAQPLPFWEAVDRLCEAGALRYGMPPNRGFGPSRGFLVLMADRTGHGPASDSGPFRVQVTGVHSVYERDFTLGPDPDPRGTKPPGSGELTLPLAVLPEPGLGLHLGGPAIVTEATDDRGRSLVPASPPQLDPVQAQRSRQFASGFAPIQVNATLTAPDPPGTMIRRLRGQVPVIVVARVSDPIVIPLKGDGAPTQVSTREMTMIVDEVKLAPGSPASVRVTFRFDPGNPFTGARPDPRRPDFAAFNRDRVLEHLELHDAAGRRLDHGTNGQTRGADNQGFYDRYQLTVPPASGGTPAGGPGTSKAPVPAELRYYGFVQTSTEIPFDFRDIPMP